MHKLILIRVISIFIAAIWFINGLFCKLLNLVPRHQQIVAKILGEDYGWILTKAIGVSELLMVVWILSGIQPRLCAISQMAIISAMIGIEVILVPELLLFGKANLIPGFLFICLIFFNEFILKKMVKNKSLQKVS